MTKMLHILALLEGMGLKNSLYTVLPDVKNLKVPMRCSSEYPKQPQGGGLQGV